MGIKLGRAFFCAVLQLVFIVSGFGLNFIKDGNFDDQVKGFWKRESWHDSGNTDITIEKVKSGKYALKISTASDENDIAYEQAVVVKPKTFYKLSGWIATRDLKVNATQADWGAVIGVDQGLNGKVFAGNLRGSMDWQYAELYFKTSPKQKSVTVQARIGMFFSTVMGTAFFDDIQLVETSQPLGNYFTLRTPEDDAEGASTTAVKQIPPQANVVITVPPLVWLIILGSAMIGLNILFTLRRDKKNRENTVVKDQTQE
jgi:hypothetical protein